MEKEGEQIAQQREKRHAKDAGLQRMKPNPVLFNIPG